MTNEDDMIIREAARRICAQQVFKNEGSDHAHYMSGRLDNAIWMRLVEQGIRKGIEIGRAL